MQPRFASLCPRALLLLVTLLMLPLSRPAAGASLPAAISAGEVRTALIQQQGALLLATGARDEGAFVTPRRYRRGEVVVHLRESAAGAAPQRLAASVDATILEPIPELHAFRIRLRQGSVADAIARLEREPEVERAEPNAIFTTTKTPNDPLYSFQTPYLDLIHAPDAWNQQTGDPSLIVAVLDTGVDIEHPDLIKNIWVNPRAGSDPENDCGTDLHGCNFVDGRDVDPACRGASDQPAPNPDVTPDFWHGTFVAGVIGAQGDNAQGVTGVAWRVTLMPVRVGDCTGPDADSVARGILYAGRNGARVINMSFGEDPGADNICHASSQLVADAIRIAHDRYGAVLVAASGNGNSPNGFLGCVDYPAAYPQVIAVGASAPGDVKAPFSQYGPEVAVAAPGTQIASTSTPRLNQLPPNDLYRIADGTSFATPIVSGEAALLLSQNHLLTPEQVRSLIQAGAVAVDDGDAPNWAGAGRVDIAASLKLVPAGLYGVIASPSPIADGTPVEARIGSISCGTGTTFTLDGKPAYAVFVPPFAAASGCGLPGAIVDVSVNGHRGGAAVWRPSDIRLDLNLPQ